jgi:hypothetical protein
MRELYYVYSTMNSAENSDVLHIVGRVTCGISEHHRVDVLMPQLLEPRHRYDGPRIQFVSVYPGGEVRTACLEARIAE